MTKVVCETDNNYEINVIPDELNGFKDFMNVVLEAELSDVRAEAARFICQMYCHLSPDLSHRRDEIVREFVESLLKSIRASFEKKEDNKQLGYLCLLEGMMN